MEALTVIPDRFSAGTTVSYSRRYSEFPAGQGWALTLYLAGGANLSVAGGASGDAFAVVLAAGKTATVPIDCDFTAGSRTLTRAAGDFLADGILAGYLVSGLGIPSNAYVVQVAADQVILNDPTTAAGSGVSIPFRFPPGVYQWVERLANAGVVQVGDQGTVNIDPDPSGAPAGALQSWEAQMLPLVEDILAGRVSSDMESYQIADRAKTAVRVRDWMAFRSYLKATIAQQRSPGKLLVGRAVFSGVSAE